MLAVSFCPLGTDLQPYLFKNQQLVRLAKFQVEVASTPQPTRLCLQDRNVTATAQGICKEDTHPSVGDRRQAGSQYCHSAAPGF